MIDQVKSLLAERHLTHVAIIDDAYDLAPTLGDIADNRWDRFFDDLEESDEVLVRECFPKYDEMDASALRHDSAFLIILWQQRNELTCSTALFEEFDRDQLAKRDRLAKLTNTLINDLGLSCTTAGRDETTVANEAEIIFIDLFLGRPDDDTAVERALERLKSVLQNHSGNPPIVVLMSESMRLKQYAPKFRDEAPVLGSLFRTAQKTELADPQFLMEQLYDLATGYNDALKVIKFSESWLAALDLATNALLGVMRKLDLPDYANIYDLVLQAEEEPLGIYMLELFDTYLHYILEGDRALLAAATDLNEIQWQDYPPMHFGPSPEAIDVLDGTIFHHEARSKAQLQTNDFPVQLGDLLVKTQAQTAALTEQTSVQSPPTDALVVLTQGCDLQHALAKSVLFLPGQISPYSWKSHKRSAGNRTPIVRLGDAKYVVEFDEKTPITWMAGEVEERINAKHEYQRARRFRPLYALKLQQLFIGNLGRVATPTPLPARYPVGVQIYYKDTGGNAILLAETSANEEKVLCLTGRNAKNQIISRLILLPDFQRLLRDLIAAVPEEKLHSDNRAKLVAARKDFEFYRALRTGLEFSQTDNSRCFEGKSFDVVQVLPKQFLEPGSSMKQLAPLVFRVVGEDPPS